jgi:hypothetical protein
MNSDQDLDLFGTGRAALAASRAAFGGRAFFVGARRLQQGGSWLGPREAVCSLVEEEDLARLGGLPAAERAGANTAVCGLAVAVAREAHALGMRCLVRVPFAAGESSSVRRVLLDQVGELLRQVPAVDGFVPTPVDEALGLDTIQFFAACRMACPSSHIVVDLERLGHKLGQLCLSFGADEILGPIVNQRALRLGAHASSNEITRDEAILLLRASGFVPCERLPEGKVQAL